MGFACVRTNRCAELARQCANAEAGGVIAASGGRRLSGQRHLRELAGELDEAASAAIGEASALKERRSDLGRLAGVMREMLGANNEERETRIRLQVRIYACVRAMERSVCAPMSMYAARRVREWCGTGVGSVWFAGNVA